MIAETRKGGGSAISRWIGSKMGSNPFLGCIRDTWQNFVTMIRGKLAAFWRRLRQRTTNEERLVLAVEELEAKLLPRLVGNVFHVTTWEAYAKIQTDRAIRVNSTGEFPFTYGQSENSFFRKRGCICIFDLRSATSAQIKETLDKFYFLKPHRDINPVFLFLKDCCFERLIPWSKPERGEMWMIPYVEAGYPGDISLDLIDHALMIEVSGVVESPRVQLPDQFKIRTPISSAPFRSGTATTIESKPAPIV